MRDQVKKPKQRIIQNFNLSPAMTTFEKYLPKTTRAMPGNSANASLFREECLAEVIRY